MSKYLSDIESVKTEKIIFEPDKFLELIHDEPKMPNYVTAQGATASSTSHLILGRTLGICEDVGVLYTGPFGTGLNASKPLQVSKYYVHSRDKCRIFHTFRFDLVYSILEK